MKEFWNGFYGLRISHYSLSFSTTPVNFLFPFYNSLYIFKKQEYSNASGYVFPYLCRNEIIGMGLYLGTAALEKTES